VAAKLPWLLFVHHIPPKPGYLRAKAGRRLAALGAVALKNAVYALPGGESRQEDLAWLAREIEDGGGRAFVCHASFVAGLDDAQVRALFVAASEREYARLAAAMRPVLDAPPPSGQDRLQAALDAFTKEFNAALALDHFGAPSRETIEGLLAGLRARLHDSQPTDAALPNALATLRGRTWVTRRCVHVDRIASAWLIRRFIDPDARLRFVDESSYVHQPGELRFDMFSGEFTHEGDLCTFEVLARRLDADDLALRKLAELVHDIDLKEERYAHPETAGLQAALEALALTVSQDAQRIEQGTVLFNLLYERFRIGR